MKDLPANGTGPDVSAKIWMLAIGAASVVTLGAGIPFAAATQAMSFTTVTGTVTDVDLPRHVVAIDPGARPGIRTSARLYLDLPPGQRISTPGGTESLGHLVPGQFIRARAESHGRHRVRWIQLEPR